jgi:hypothetical protein
MLENQADSALVKLGKREVDLNVRPSSQAVRPIFVHARRKRNAMNGSMVLAAAILGGAATLLEMFRKPE